MNDALTLTVQAMHTDLQRVEALSHNMSNATTPGYRRQVNVTRPFLEHMNPPEGTTRIQGSGPTVDLSIGAIKQTHRALDLAIQGSAFFVVQGPTDPAYTRQGDFQIDSQGRLATTSGYPVLGQQGEITVGSGAIEIDQHGLIKVDGRPIDTLRLVKFDSDIQMKSLGNNLLVPIKTAEPVDDKNVTILSGSLEAANVVPMREMVSLMETMRHFEASQRLVQAYDEAVGKSIQKLGEF
ncbi:flagellar hook basal-body protein [Chitinivorax sp. B]|uniref:flagellar hook-basal body protein n=1 Tax=Chitinivorax sp. B TaxID=2502235 RepID=UPI0010F62094|nr:flagellar hook basal-body protein [Chitinivorax sp. B]